ncbi:hypothetical protein AB2T90_12120 [Clostridium butyricum]
MKVKDLINKLKELDEDDEIGYLETISYGDDGVSFCYEARPNRRLVSSYK